MSQHDYVLENDNGADFRADLNLALQAILTQNSGTSEPTTTAAYMFWADTTAGLLKQRNAANNAWITLGKMANFLSGLQAANYGGTSGGSANAQTITLPIPPTAYSAGMMVWWISGYTNTSTVTLNANSIGNADVKKNGALALLPGDLLLNKIAIAIHDGTSFQLLNPATGGKGADLASASTVDLSGSSGDYADLTGTTTVNAFTLPEGREFTIRAAGAVPLVNSANLVIPGGSRTMAAGDYMILRGRASGVVHVISYLPTSGAAVTGNGPVIVAGGNITSADQTLTYPAGTWSRITGVVQNSQAASSHQVSLRLNADSSSLYTYTQFYWRIGTSGDQEGGTLQNGMPINLNVTKVDDNAGTLNPMCFEFTLHNPSSATFSKIISCEAHHYRNTSGNFVGLRSDGRYSSATAITGASLHYRDTAGAGVTGATVTPVSGSYYWICEP